MTQLKLLLTVRLFVHCSCLTLCFNLMVHVDIVTLHFFVSNSYSLDFRRDTRMAIFNSLYVILQLLVVGSFCLKITIFFIFRKKWVFRKTISISNSLYPNQARQNVGPDLGPNCLQMITAVTTKVATGRLMLRLKIVMLENAITIYLRSSQLMGITSFSYVKKRVKSNISEIILRTFY